MDHLICVDILDREIGEATKEEFLTAAPKVIAKLKGGKEPG